MHNRYDRCHVAVQREEDTERKARRDRTTDVPQDDRKLEGRTFDALKGGTNRLKKLAAEAGPLAIVLYRGRKRLGLGLRADPELRHLPGVVATDFADARSPRPTAAHRRGRPDAPRDAPPATGAASRRAGPGRRLPRSGPTATGRNRSANRSATRRTPEGPAPHCSSAGSIRQDGRVACLQAVGLLP